MASSSPNYLLDQNLFNFSIDAQEIIQLFPLNCIEKDNSQQDSSCLAAKKYKINYPASTIDSVNGINLYDIEQNCCNCADHQINLKFDGTELDQTKNSKTATRLNTQQRIENCYNETDLLEFIDENEEQSPDQSSKILRGSKQLQKQQQGQTIQDYS